MVYPIVVYGSPVLRKVAGKIDKDYPNLQKFIADMWETMYKSDGVGLAAPQIGKSVRMFVIDTAELDEKNPDLQNFKKTFINPEIINREGEITTYNEGCLSLPKIHEDVNRESKVRIQYYDENWQFHDEEYDGVKARVIQHEYDHLQGILFIDHLSPLRKKLLKGKLNDITKGKVDVDYKIKVLKN
ncbi:MAG: peptide deformylase [Bacteroidales bacterium]|nr:peptide deformylase [Bacteroidales bacterium]